MEPARIIEELCRRYRVSPKWGGKLLPLVERAQVVAPEAASRILDLVERSFAEEARRAREEEARRGADDADHRVLRAVAPILHDWSPPRWLRKWQGGESGSGDAPGTEDPSGGAAPSS